MRGNLIAKCCDCGQIRSGTRWEQERKPPEILARYSHTYCPVCLQKVLVDINRYRENAADEMREAG